MSTSTLDERDVLRRRLKRSRLSIPELSRISGWGEVYLRDVVTEKIPGCAALWRKMAEVVRLPEFR